jgi:hypothetical protein
MRGLKDLRSLCPPGPQGGSRVATAGRPLTRWSDRRTCQAKNGLHGEVRKGVFNMRYIGVLAALGLIMAGAGPANATIVAIDGPFETGSWTARFQENGYYYAPGTTTPTHYNFDQLQSMICTPGAFESPGMANFTVAGWSGATNGVLAVADGASVGNLYWDFHFAGSSSTAFNVYSQAWSGNTLLGEQILHYNGSGGWSYTYPSSTWNAQEIDRSSIPEPVTMAGLMMGIGGLVTYVRKRRKA